MAGNKTNLPNLRGAIALPDPGKRTVFMPPTALDVKRVRAANLMNKTPELTRAWHDAVNGMVKGLDEGLDVVEGVVPEGGADVLSLLGFHVQFVCKRGPGDLVRVCLTAPFVTSKVLS